MNSKPNKYFLGERSFETAELEKENDALEAEIAEASIDTDGANKFIALIEKYENFDELTNPTLL